MHQWTSYKAQPPLWDLHKAPYPDNPDLPPIDMASRYDGSRRNMAQEIRDNSGVPVMYRNTMLQNMRADVYTSGNFNDVLFRCSKLLAKYEKWKNSNMGMYIYSQEKGAGKTMLASALLNELVTKYAITAKYISCSELITKKSDKTYNFPALWKVQVLVIDDLGQSIKSTSKVLEWLDEILFQILDKRVSNNLITIYTSNLDVQQLPFSDAIKRRVRDYTMFVHLPEECISEKALNIKKDALVN